MFEGVVYIDPCTGCMLIKVIYDITNTAVSLQMLHRMKSCSYFASLSLTVQWVWSVFQLIDDYMFLLCMFCSVKNSRVGCGLKYGV